MTRTTVDPRPGQGAGRAARGAAHPAWALALIGLGYAGYVKGLPALSELGVDLTGLFAALVACGVLLQAVRGRGVGRAALVVLGLWFTFLVGAAGGLWYESGPYKVALLFTVTLLCALAPAWLLGREESRRWLIAAVTIAGLAMAAALVLNPDREMEALYGRLTLEGSNSIATARVVGAGAAVALVQGLVGTRHRLLWLGSASAMAAVLVLVGSRGPFVGLVAAVVLALLLGKNGRGVRRVYLVAVGLLTAVILVLVVATSQNRAAGRIGELLTGASTDETRLALMRRCVAAISEHVLGIGWGGFPSVALEGALQSRYTYPHNMVLEILVEGGWLAGVAFLLVVAGSLTGFWRRSETPEGVALLTMGIYWVMVAQTSGDVNANRMTWVMLGLGLVLLLTGTPQDGRSSPEELEPRPAEQSATASSGRPAVSRPLLGRTARSGR